MCGSIHYAFAVATEVWVLFSLSREQIPESKAREDPHRKRLTALTCS